MSPYILGQNFLDIQACPPSYILGAKQKRILIENLVREKVLDTLKNL